MFFYKNNIFRRIHVSKIADNFLINCFVLFLNWLIKIYLSDFTYKNDVLKL